MQRLLSYNLIFIFILFLIAGCSNGDSGIQTSPFVTTNDINRNSTRCQDLTTEDLELISQLSFINDSIAYTSNITCPNTDFPTNILSDMGPIAAADAEGFFKGLIVGWKSAKGWNKLWQPFVYATAFSVYNSLLAAFFMLISDEVASVDFYSIDDVDAALVSTYINDKNKEEALKYAITHNIIVTKSTEEMFIDAYTHNFMLKELRNKPSIDGSLSDIISQEQIDHLHSEQVSSICKAMSDDLKSNNHIQIDSSFKTESIIMSYYIKGILTLELYDYKKGKQPLNNLCHEYIEIINNHPDLDLDHKEALISACFVAPLSYEYWNENGIQYLNTLRQ